MSKEALAELIDAYADAKASNNKILIQTMIRQLEMALDSLFPSTEPEPTPETNGVILPEEGEY
jgi:hypothetical protein|tara:strand:- start:2322 stop:2510 length:189 start_codon:yes stop_codon:yes gene_type:complete